jgi:hypothetical protein
MAADEAIAKLRAIPLGETLAAPYIGALEISKERPVHASQEMRAAKAIREFGARAERFIQDEIDRLLSKADAASLWGELRLCANPVPRDFEAEHRARRAWFHPAVIRREAEPWWTSEETDAAVRLIEASGEEIRAVDKFGVTTNKRRITRIQIRESLMPAYYSTHPDSALLISDFMAHFPGLQGGRDFMG